jgi:hypothetical protein
LRGALVTPTVTPRAAIVAPKAYGELLRAIEDYEGAPETRAALELLALTFVRPGELRAAEWAEFDLDAAVWEIPAGRMKMLKPHRVPLAPRTVSILRELLKLTGQCKFLFPSVRSVARCMSENTLNAALRRMGFKNQDMTSHGFRASASSMLNECGLWNADAIELQLAHVDGDSVRRAYARAEFWGERVKMMASPSALPDPARISSSMAGTWAARSKSWPPFGARVERQPSMPPTYHLCPRCMVSPKRSDATILRSILLSTMPGSASTIAATNVRSARMATNCASIRLSPDPIAASCPYNTSRRQDGQRVLRRTGEDRLRRRHAHARL